MQNDHIKVAVRDFQRKLDFFKIKIQHQQLLAQSLAAEFDSLTSEFESLNQLFDASSSKIESTLEKNSASSFKTESTLMNFDATLFKSESTSEELDTSSFKFESSSEKIESSSSNGASSSIGELASLVWRSAKEQKIYFGQPDIPNRMAEILLTLREKKKLTVAEMRQITGVSRNTLVRDIKVLKLLGWLEFHGSRKNGYFKLTDSVPDVLVRKEGG